VKALCANLTDPVKLSVTNALKETLSIDVCIILVGPGCAKICVDGLNQGKTKNLEVGSTCSPTNVYAEIVSTNQKCSANVGGGSRNYKVVSVAGAGCRVVSS
jgi:hypothetical protein